jgi:hypothetical protein
VAGMAASVIDDLEAIKLHSERIVGDLFEEGSDHGPAGPSIPMAAPDTGSWPNSLNSTHATLQFLTFLMM